MDKEGGKSFEEFMLGENSDGENNKVIEHILSMLTPKVFEYTLAQMRDSYMTEVKGNIMKLE